MRPDSRSHVRASRIAPISTKISRHPKTSTTHFQYHESRSGKTGSLSNLARRPGGKKDIYTTRERRQIAARCYLLIGLRSAYMMYATPLMLLATIAVMNAREFTMS